MQGTRGCVPGLQGLFSLGRRMVSGTYSGGITLAEEVVCLSDGWRWGWACRAVARTDMPSRPSRLGHPPKRRTGVDGEEGWHGRCRVGDRPRPAGMGRVGPCGAARRRPRPGAQDLDEALDNARLARALGPLGQVVEGVVAGGGRSRAWRWVVGGGR
jgi:hypothetical protein